MMVRIHCDYDAGMPLSYRGIAIEQDGLETVRFSADGYDGDVRRAMRHVVEQFDTIPSLASSLWHFQQDAAGVPNHDVDARAFYASLGLLETV
jgi:hypothetical protein